MGKYIHLFETNAEFQAMYNDDDKYIEPWTSYTKESGSCKYNKTEEEKMFETPFTIEALGSGNIAWKLGDLTVQYSKNGGPWTTMDSATTISVAEGDKIQFKGYNSGYFYYDGDEGAYIGNNLISTVDCNVYGNIMSLTNGNNFENADTVDEHTFYSLFYDYSEETSFRVVNAKNLKLPATTLADFCYENMFYGCTSLITAPELPATTLAQSCYSQMFYGCTSLTIAPALPAITLANSCYNNMFSGCTSLNYIKAMFTTTPSSDYTAGWVDGVAATGTFVKNSAATWNVTGDNGIPTGWTVETATQ